MADDSRQRWFRSLSRGSLRRRLTLTYTAALAVGLLIFAFLSLLTIDRTLKNTLDARLATTARAFAATAAGHADASRLDVPTTQRLLAALGVQQSGAILTADGSVAMESTVIPQAVAQAARQATNDRLSYSTVSDEGGLRVVSMVLSSTGGSHVVEVLWRPLDIIADYERIAGMTLAVASVVIVVLAFLAGTTIVQRGLEPLRTMAAVASEIEAHDLTRRLSNRAWDDELRDFAATFDRMLERVQRAFLRQRQFTADASHDLRAPLAVMRAEVDLALIRGGQEPADDASFRSIQDEIQEFGRLLDALLLAARADAGPVQRRPIDLIELADRASCRIRPFAASRSVRISNDIRTTSLILGDPDILERVIISLLHNGIKFSPPNGTISVDAVESTTTVSLIVRDQGPGFSDEALIHAFDRFWKDDAARGRSGTGLGLAIAKTAVERVGGAVRIRNSSQGGAEIETVFPICH